MKRTLIILILALFLAGCDDSYTVQGEFTDDHGVQRVVGTDNRDGALVTIPKAQTSGNPQSGDCIRGGLIYSKAACPK